LPSVEYSKIAINVRKRNRIKWVEFLIANSYFAAMISNQLNIIEGVDPEADALKKLGNRIKSLRIDSGHLNYEKFAYKIGVGRILLRRVELGGNINYKNLLKIINGLGVTPAEFFSQGLD
jgi:hypothetical protein